MGQERAFHILDGMGGDLAALPSLERDSGNEVQGTAQDAAWEASGVDNEVEGVHDSHEGHLLESMVGGMELMIAMVPSCHDGMRVLVDGRLNSLIFAVMDDVQNATPFAFGKLSILIAPFSRLIRTYLYPLPPPLQWKNRHLEFHPSRLHSRPW